MASRGIKDQVAIIGMGCTNFGEHWDKSVDDMLIEAAHAAYESAGIKQDDLDAYWFGTLGSAVSGLALSRALKIDYKPVTRVENMCATGSEAFRNAAYAVASGAYDMVMAIGVEKLKDNGMSGLVGAPLPSDGTESTLTAPASFSLLAPAYADKYGVDRDEMKEVMARIAWKNHYNGARNPRAQFQKEVSMDKIKSAPLIAGDLGIYDCSGVSDGSAAAILCRAEDAHKYTDNPLYVKALSFTAGPAAGPIDSDYDYTTFHEVSAALPMPMPKLASPTLAPKSPWPKYTTASPQPNLSSWKILVSPSVAWAGKKSWPAPTTSTANFRLTPTAGSKASDIPLAHQDCACCSNAGCSSVNKHRRTAKSSQ